MGSRNLRFTVPGSMAPAFALLLTFSSVANAQFAGGGRPDVELIGKVANLRNQEPILLIGSVFAHPNNSFVRDTIRFIYDLRRQQELVEILQSPAHNNFSGRGMNQSRDGGVIVGFADTGFFTPRQAFRWTDETGLVRLGTLDPTNPDLETRAYDVSDDGNLVVGHGDLPEGSTQAFRWTQESGFDLLGTPRGEPGDISAATAVSGDGSVVVGSATFDSPFGPRSDAFLWTEVDGFINLNEDFPGRSEATAVTQDGTAVVGGARNHAFRWTEGTELVDLGTLPGDTHSIATAVSDDGNIVVGISSSVVLDRSDPYYLFDEENSRAFYWTPKNGMQDLTQLLTDAGLDMSDKPLVGARGISPDGEWISAITIVPDEEFPELFVDQVPVLVSLTATLPDLVLTGDYDDDGFVGQGDLDLVLLTWGDDAGRLPATWINQRPGAGIVGQEQLDAVLLNWGETAASAARLTSTGAVPEPGKWTILLLLAGSYAATRFRPRGMSQVKLFDGRCGATSWVRADGLRPWFTKHTMIKISIPRSNNVIAGWFCTAALVVVVQLLAIQSCATAATSVSSGLDDAQAIGNVFKRAGEEIIIAGKVKANDVDSLVFEAIEFFLDLATRRTGGNHIHSNARSHFSSSGLNLSRDGNTLVGFADTGFFTPSQAFRWTAETGIVRLGTLDAKNDNLDSRAFDVSDDGSVIVGDATTPNFFLRAVRWTEETGLTNLGTATGEGDDDFSRALGISGDGSVIVGSSTFDTSFGKREDAFRWTEGGGFVNLNDGLPGRSIANAVTQDGNVVIGGARNHAFRWTDETGLIDLGTLPGDSHSMATAVSDDGTIVVGMSSTGPIDRSNPYYLFDEENSRAFYWTEVNGMQDLTQLLTDAGLDMSDTPLVGARGMSTDGEWISAITIVPDEEFPDLFVDQVPVFVSLTATLPDPVLSGDYDDDGFVGQGDLDLVLLTWGDAADIVPAAWINQRPTAGIVGQSQLDGVLLNWGRSSSEVTNAAVPEPSSEVIMLGVLLVIMGACPRASWRRDRRTN